MIRNIFFALSIVSLCTNLLLPQKAAAEKSPYKSYEDSQLINTAMWDLQLAFDVTAASGGPGNAGAEFDGTYFYTTRWASNLIHKYDVSGNLIEEFSIPGVSGLRDLAFDGTYFYGGADANTIYRMNFNTKTLEGTISSPVQVRFIAYDEQNDAFWCGSWTDDPTLVSRNGTVLASFSTGLAHQYGAAYENVNTGGPYLWIFDQGGGAGTPQIISQWSIYNGTATGVAHDVMLDLGSGNPDGIAGGLFIANDIISGRLSIGGVLQGSPDILFAYDFLECAVAPPSNPNPPDYSVNVPVNVTHLSWTNSPGALSSLLYFGTHPDSLVMVQSGSLDSLWNIPQGFLPLDYLTTYFWRIRNLGTACGPTQSDWRFTTEAEIPVELISFTADVIDGKVRLNWSTSTETNNKGFEIERSFEVVNALAKTWKQMGFIEGAGTTTELKMYSFTDKGIPPGIYHYRLRQIDFNGTSEYSDIVEAEIFLPPEFTLEQNYPNPFNPVTTINFSVPDEALVNLGVYNVLGEQVKELKNEIIKRGYYEVEFNASALPSGIYFYRIEAVSLSGESGDFIQTKKMILLR